MFDAIVVGARCAGSPTAMLLAQLGHRVLLLDRSRFPSDIMSTHLVKPSGVLRLLRWRLLDPVVATGCPPVRQITFDIGDCAVRAPMSPLDGIAEIYAPRRTVLDKILVDAAVAAGAELRERVTVTELLRHGARVVGVRARTAQGTIVEERAAIVIGADGLRSIVAHAVAASSYDAVPTTACWYYSYWSGVNIAEFKIHTRPGQYVLAFPTNDGLTCVLVGWPVSAFHEVRSDIDHYFHGALARTAPDLADQIRAGRREERYVGTAHVHGFFRPPFGLGWALVGDAGYHRDPSTGWGITDAFRDAELLAAAIHAGASGEADLGAALRHYEHSRNTAARPYYQRTCLAASLQPVPAGMRALVEALREQPSEAARFMGAIQGTLPLDEYLAPANVQRIVAASSSSSMGR